MIESPPGFGVQSAAQQAADSNGFRIERGVEGGWIKFRSATAPGAIWIGGAGPHGPWFLAIEKSSVAREFADQTEQGLAGPGALRLSFATGRALHEAVGRVYRLAISLPDAPLNQFEQATAALPRTTEAERLVVQRVGQDIFREALMNYWDRRCPLTGIAEPALLRASHIVPWAVCEDDAQRLDVHNGLLLSSLWDAAFDSGLVSFADDGLPLVSAALSAEAKKGLALESVGPIPRLTGPHRSALRWHRIRHGFDLS